MSKDEMLPFEPKFCTKKPRWPAGPWHNEPDLRAFDVLGLRCAVIRHPKLGHLCGYVHVPPGHPLDGVLCGDRVKIPLAYLKFPQNPRTYLPLFFNENNEPEVEVPLNWALQVHGCVTYSEHTVDGSWFGFDCNQLGDLAPGNIHSGGDYRDWEYVVGETEMLAEQLAAWPGVAG